MPHQPLVSDSKLSSVQNEIPSDQEIASQECKQSQIKNQVIETLEKVILDIKTLK